MEEPPDTEYVMRRIYVDIVEQFGVSSDWVTPDRHLTAYAQDHLDMWEFFAAIEEDFDIEIPESEQLRIQTAAELETVVLKKLKEKSDS